MRFFDSLFAFAQSSLRMTHISISEYKLSEHKPNNFLKNIFSHKFEISIPFAVFKFKSADA